MIDRNIYRSSVVVQRGKVLMHTRDVYRLDEKRSGLNTREINLEVVLHLNAHVVHLLEERLETLLIASCSRRICSDAQQIS